MIAEENSCTGGVVLSLLAGVEPRPLHPAKHEAVRREVVTLKNRDELRREIEVLRDRLSRLSAAVLRVSASLDLNTVLQEVVESARALTGARYGAITTIDAVGQPRDFVSSGLTPEEHRQLLEWSDGPRLFEYFRELRSPLRLQDLPAYVRSLGISSDLMLTKTLQATPMRHRGTQVGNFFLGDKQRGQEFTDEDEEVLMLFAAQAATAIANARTYRDEQRARADLEALIDTSPVGVVVFEASSGAAVSINQEARRIVDGLRMPGRSPEELLEVVTCQRAEGQEVSLAEFPLAQQLVSAETVRAEEIVLSVPDGRRVKTLINATPIRSADGEVESVVVTMQDLAPLEELERMRAEFLGMVSHELRAPLSSIKGSAATVLGASRRLDAAEVAPVLSDHRGAGGPDGRPDQRLAGRGAHRDRHAVGRPGADGRDGAGGPGTEHVHQRRRPSRRAHGPAAGVAAGDGRPAAHRAGSEQSLVQRGEALPRFVSHPDLGHGRWRACCDLGIRRGPRRAPGAVAAPVPQASRTCRRRAGARGRRLRPGGLAICKGLVEAHGGRIRADSAGVGQGTRVTFTIPVLEDSRGSAAAGLAASDPAGEGRKQQASILVVDDDPAMLHYARDALVSAGYVPVVTGDPREVADLVSTHKPQLVLLDLVLPETDGIELMQSIPALQNLPVIFISGYGRDETIARALDLGAADYIVKPFSATELTARVRAALRRRTGAQPFVLGDLSIDYEQRRVSAAGRAVPLTATEFELLRVLSVNAGRVLTCDSLLRQVWARRESANVMLLRSLMKRLRRKLGDKAARPAYIFTERGVGYRMPRPGDS